jgi:hypothetical protein
VGFFYHRKGSFESPVISTPIAIFELVSFDATRTAILYSSMYFPRRSTKVPNGLTRRSWSSLRRLDKDACKIVCLGVTHGLVNDFPFGLPSMIEQSEELATISPDLPSSQTQLIRDMLSQSLKELGKL